MKYFEYGKGNKELAVMLHGGVSYQGAEPTVQTVAQKYHGVLAACDGFNPSEPETEFVSAQNEARRLGGYIVGNYGGHIDILYGISYGGRVLMEVLADKRLTIADGISLKDYPDIKSRAGKDSYCFFLTGFFYIMMADPGPVPMKFLCKVTGKDPKEADHLLYRRATWKSWKNQDYCLIGKKTDYSVFGRTDMRLWYGIKGVVDKKLSANLEKLKKQGYPFQYKIFTELGHGDIMNHPEQLVSEWILFMNQ